MAEETKEEDIKGGDKIGNFEVDKIIEKLL